MPSKPLPIHTVIKNMKISVRKWNTHQEYVARMYISFYFLTFFFFETAKSIRVFIDTASSFKWCFTDIKYTWCRIFSNKRQIFNWASCITIPGYRAIGSTMTLGRFYWVPHDNFTSYDIITKKLKKKKKTSHKLLDYCHSFVFVPWLRRFVKQRAPSTKKIRGVRIL